MTTKAHNNQWFDAVIDLNGSIETVTWPDVSASRVAETDSQWCLTFRADNGADAIGKCHEIAQRGCKLAPDKYRLLSLRSGLTGPVTDVPLIGPNPDVRVKHKRVKDATAEMFAPAEVERQIREGAISRENEAWR